MNRIEKLRRDKQFVVRCLKACRESIRVGFNDTRHKLGPDVIHDKKFGDELRRLVLMDLAFWTTRETSVNRGLHGELFDLSFFRAQLTIINLQLGEKTE